MSAGRRRTRDARRRRLGQNFLRSDLAETFVADASVTPGELVVEIGPGSGAVTSALLRRGARVLAIEADPRFARALPGRMPREDRSRLRVVCDDFLRVPVPGAGFRVIGSLPFGRTTEILSRLLDRFPERFERADLIVQWEVARKRAAQPPTTLRSAAWAPWWEFRAGMRIPAEAFRPIPSVDAGVLIVMRRAQPLLPPAMSADYLRFVREHWPFERSRSRSRRGAR